MITKTLKKLTALYYFSAWSIVLLFPFVSQATELNQIQQQIKQQQQKIAEQKIEQNKLKSSLQSQENKINDVVGALRETELSLKETKKIIQETQRQIQRLEQQQKEQKNKLAKQLNAIYRTNNTNSVIEHLLSDQAQNNDRMLAYAKHMNQSRLVLIEQLKNTQQQLEQQKHYLSSQQQEQQNQFSKQKKQQQALLKIQQERQTTLDKLNKSLERDQTKLEQLKANENALRNEIKRAAEQAKQQEKKELEQLSQKQKIEEKRTNTAYKPNEKEKQLLNSSHGLKGKYSFPISGKILHSFGSTQVGEIKWKGIVIAANTGTPVKAIAGGRVILASWLTGYGQVVVIDHGKGYMSLYGYNQAVFVKAGTLVNAGQKIAEVGNSGGQNRSALYFEIRRQGNAVNPMNWLG